MNERIKELRLALGLSLEAFGSRIGLGKSSVSKIERGLNSTTDQTVLSICREYGVNETWLRTGAGAMFSQDRKTVIDRVAEEYKLDTRERAIVTAYLELDPADRAAIVRYLESVMSKLAPPAPSVPDTVAAGIAAQQDYAAMLAEEKDPAAGSSSTAG